MEFESRIVLSALGALFGFFLSQSFSIIRYLRRPRFRLEEVGEGVVSSYSGDPPETPAELTFGFQLRNVGRNPAKNTRVFVSDLLSASASDAALGDGVFEFSELKKPINIIPPGQSLLVVFATMTSEKPYLEISFEHTGEDGLEKFVEADTRGKKVFEAQFYVSCDDVDSFAKFKVRFSAEGDFVEDYIFMNSSSGGTN